MRLASILVLALLVPNLSVAGGSLATDELDQLIGQMPLVRDFLRSTLTLSNSAYAEVRLGSHFKNLGGTRMGPYTVMAKSKSDGSPLVVVLCTKARFLSKSGKELPDKRIEEAASVQEKLTGVLLLQEGHSEGRPPC